jgi:hypothetical protein
MEEKINVTEEEIVLSYDEMFIIMPEMAEDHIDNFGRIEEVTITEDNWIQIPYSVKLAKHADELYPLFIDTAESRSIIMRLQKHNKMKSEDFRKRVVTTINTYLDDKISIETVMTIFTQMCR